MLLTLFCADTPLGRFSHADLSHQSLMELLANGFDEETQRSFTDLEGNFLDFCNNLWVRCNPEREVIQFSIFDEHTRRIALRGTLETKYLPSTLQGLTITHFCEDMAADPEAFFGEIGGTLDFAALPNALRTMQVVFAPFAGSVAFTALPHELRRLQLQNCAFDGSIELGALPQKIEHIILARNRFVGTFNFENLPPSLSELDVSYNLLSGSFSLENIPESLKKLSIASNAFTGETDMSQIPKGLRFAWLGNDFIVFNR